MKKCKQKPPKFYVSTAMKDMKGCIEYWGDGDIYNMVISSLQKLSEAVSRNQLAPLPMGLEGSVFDPKMLDLRSDEEFVDIYKENFKDTAEAYVTNIVYIVLAHDTIYGSRCRVHQFGIDEMFDYSTGSVLNNIKKNAIRLHIRCLDKKYVRDIPKMLSILYPYVIQFAEVLQFDLNAFLKWKIRYRKCIGL